MQAVHACLKSGNGLTAYFLGRCEVGPIANCPGKKWKIVVWVKWFVGDRSSVGLFPSEDAVLANVTA